MIDVKVFEWYFNESNKETPKSLNVIEVSCVCDWIIFLKWFLISTSLEQKLICLMDVGIEDKNL